MNGAANADSKAAQVAQSQFVHGDQKVRSSSSTGGGWPLEAVHRGGDQDWNRVENWTIGYARLPTKERKSFAEIVRTGHHQEVGDTSAAAPQAATNAAQQSSDCALCDLSAIENLSVRSVLQSVLDDAGAELRNELRNKLRNSSETDGALPEASDSGATIANSASCGVDIAPPTKDALDAGATRSADQEGSDYDALYRFAGSENSSFFKDDVFETAPATLLDFVRQRSASNGSFAQAYGGLAPAPLYPSGAVFVCLNCGEASNVGAYTIREVNAGGGGRRRSKRFRNRGGHTVTHHSRRYNVVVGPQAGRFRTAGAGKRKTGYRQEINL